MENLTFPAVGKFVFRFIAFLVAIAVIVTVVVSIANTDAAIQAEAASISPAMESLGPGQEGRFYYVDRKTDYVYETRYEGDIVNLQIAYNDNGEIMKSADYYAVIK